MKSLFLIFYYQAEQNEVLRILSSYELNEEEFRELFKEI